jgi:hypothetical protein
LPSCFVVCIAATIAVGIHLHQRVHCDAVVNQLVVVASMASSFVRLESLEGLSSMMLSWSSCCRSLVDRWPNRIAFASILHFHFYSNARALFRCSYLGIYLVRDFGLFAFRRDCRNHARHLSTSKYESNAWQLLDFIYVAACQLSSSAIWLL